MVENSGSYAYLDTMRAVLPNLTLPTCTACLYDDVTTTKYEFKLATREQEQSCPKYNYWKMGYEDANLYVKLRSMFSIYYFINFSLTLLLQRLRLSETSTSLRMCGTCSEPMILATLNSVPVVAATTL